MSHYTPYFPNVCFCCCLWSYWVSSPHTFHIFHYISNYIYIFTYYEFTFSITFPITFTFSLTMNLHFALHFQSHLHFHLLCFCFLLCFCPCILISCYMFAAFAFTFGQPITIPSAILVTFILHLELLSNIRTFYTHGRHNARSQQSLRGFPKATCCDVLGTPAARVGAPPHRTPERRTETRFFIYSTRPIKTMELPLPASPAKAAR